jgi:hypothetical protein
MVDGPSRSPNEAKPVVHPRWVVVAALRPPKKMSGGAGFLASLRIDAKDGGGERGREHSLSLRECWESPRPSCAVSTVAQVGSARGLERRVPCKRIGLA